MAPSIPPTPMRPHPQPAPVMSPQQWERALKVQRMSARVPEHVGSGIGLELRPRNVHFATQNKGEKVFILLRRHIITNLGWIFSSFIYILIPPALSLVLTLLNQDMGSFFSLKAITVILVIYYSLVWTNMFRHFVDWYFNVYIVTDERVVNYEFVPFVSRDITELNLQDIEDIREENVGVMASFFNFGNVSVFTAADKSVLIFKHIPKPGVVRDIISDLSKIVKESRNES